MADGDPIAECLAALHRAGWSIGEAAFATETGGQVWVVSGSNGENLIRAEGATTAGAWRSAAGRARSPR
jgi:hypothetical protein